MEREFWGLSKNVYSVGAEVYSLDPAMLYSLQQGAPASRRQEDQLKTQEIQPPDSAVGFGLSEATWPGPEGRGYNSG